MAKPEAVENEFTEVGFRLKGSQKSEREVYLQKQNDNLKKALNDSHDKVAGLKMTYQATLNKLKEQNDKLQQENMDIVAKHDLRLIKYMELKDQFDELEAAKDA